MLEASPTNIFSYNFRLREDDAPVGELIASLWWEKARVSLADGSYDLYRESLFSGDFLLARDGTIIARAAKPSVLQNKFEVHFADRHLLLRKISIWRRPFAVFDGGTLIGSIYPVGPFTRRSNIDLPTPLPLPVRVFLFWLALILWKREAAS